ncbi:hypothetical protein HELRODRAFT_169286 [Helobdella robusta]|uniref:Zinc finger PHD-type domain-containing protein n=1 Tax=Helobdella robusta TaxID=6412 RepID=T1F1Q4_HELRO|nr:hypothetical protein HELRODRAFT_169286 [Helobdella robusta]ESO08443.1 hypothetical protein HELRODRAFT_169286 [Helobdella robusta]
MNHISCLLQKSLRDCVTENVQITADTPLFCLIRLTEDFQRGSPGQPGQSGQQASKRIFNYWHNPDRWIKAVTSCIEQRNLSSAVRLVCLPEGLAESLPPTFDKLCSIHSKIPVNRRVFPALAPTAGRVSCLLAHDALTIIRNALSLPILMYFLRTYKHIDSSKLGKFDRALRTALSSICNVQEPSGISAHDCRRPDGCTLIPWRAGRCLAWDVTVPGTLAKRYVNLTSKECGLAAARAADEKMKKYGNALPSMEFLPICIEVLGPMDHNTLKFLKEIGKSISVRSAALYNIQVVGNWTIASMPNANDRVCTCCKNEIKRTEKELQCSSCKFYVHTKCVNISDSYLPVFKIKHVKFHCDGCLEIFENFDNALVNVDRHFVKSAVEIAAIRESNKQLISEVNEMKQLLNNFGKVSVAVGPEFAKEMDIMKRSGDRSADSRELFFATNHISGLLQRFLRVCVLENIQLNADMCN